MTEFDDLTKRIIDKLDTLDDKIDKLCVWKTEMETEWKNHMNTIEQKAVGKEKRFYYIIALMGVGFTLQEIIRSVLFG